MINFLSFTLYSYASIYESNLTYPPPPLPPSCPSHLLSFSTSSTSYLSVAAPDGKVIFLVNQFLVYSPSSPLHPPSLSPSLAPTPRHLQHTCPSVLPGSLVVQVCGEACEVALVSHVSIILLFDSVHGLPASRCWAVRCFPSPDPNLFLLLSLPPSLHLPNHFLP